MSDMYGVGELVVGGVTLGQVEFKIVGGRGFVYGPRDWLDQALESDDVILRFSGSDQRLEVGLIDSEGRAQVSTRVPPSA